MTIVITVILDKTCKNIRNTFFFYLKNAQNILKNFISWDEFFCIFSLTLIVGDI